MTGDPKSDCTEKKRKTNHPIDKGWAWVVCFAGCMLHVYYGLVFCTSGIMMVEYEELYKRSSSDVSWTVSILFVAFLFGSPLSSQLMKRYSSRIVIFISGLLGSLGYMTSSFSWSLEVAYFTYGVLIGLSVAFIHVPCMVIVGQYFEKHRGIAVGLTVTGGSIASFISPPLLRFLLQKYGIQNCHIVLSGLVLNVCVLACLMRPLSYYDYQVQSKSEVLLRRVNDENEDDDFNLESEKKEDSELQKSSSECLPEMRQPPSTSDDGTTPAVLICSRWLKSIFNVALLRNPFFYFYSLMLGLVGISLPMAYFVIPSRAEELNLSKDATTTILLFQGIPDLIGRVMCGIIVDMSWCNASHFLMFVGLAQSFTWIGVSFWPSFAGLMTFAQLSALEGGAYMSLYLPVLIDTIGMQNIGVGLGYALVIEGMCFMALPALTGYVFEATLSWNWSFRILGIASYIGSILLIPYQISKCYYKKRTNKYKHEMAIEILDTEHCVLGRNNSTD